MLDESKQIAMYDSAGNMPLAWAVSAESLLGAASVLSAAREAAGATLLKAGDSVPAASLSLPCELMLRGFAFECLFKAVWVKRGNVLASGGKLQKIPGTGQHNLLDLADKLGFTCSARERDVLKRLSLFIKTVGRYPIATDWTQTKIQAAHGGGWGTPLHWNTPMDDDAREAMVSRLNAELGI